MTEKWKEVWGEKIPTSNGGFALVDAGDYAWLSKWKWFVGRQGYATRSYRDSNSVKRSISMHRLIMNTPKGMETDHINGDKLDNRRANLRIATTRQNQFNSKKQQNSIHSVFKGVSFDRSTFRRKPWTATIVSNGKHLYLGKHAHEVQAAMAYNLKAVEVAEEFARLNKILPKHIPLCKQIAEMEGEA